MNGCIYFDVIRVVCHIGKQIASHYMWVFKLLINIQIPYTELIFSLFSSILTSQTDQSLRIKSSSWTIQVLARASNQNRYKICVDLRPSLRRVLSPRDPFARIFKYYSHTPLKRSRGTLWDSGELLSTNVAVQKFCSPLSAIRTKPTLSLSLPSSTLFTEHIHFGTLG